MLRNKRAVQFSFGGIALLLVAVFFGIALARRQANAEIKPAVQSSEPIASSEPEQSAAAEWGSRITYNGQSYQRNSDIRTFLFMGVDNSSTASEYVDIGANGRTDTLMLILYNRKTNETQLLQISRDTMTEVDVYSTRGKYVFSGNMQITMQYSYGDSPARGAFLTLRTVTELLYGTKIDGYLSLTMDGIAVLADAVGGLTFTFPEDCTDVDPSYTAGATVTLDGTAVERLIRSRDKEHSGGNDQRMARQGWMVSQMLNQLRTCGMSMEELLQLAATYTDTDLSADTLDDLFHAELSDEVLKVPGETVFNAEQSHDEYYVDDEALEALLIELLYTPV